MEIVNAKVIEHDPVAIEEGREEDGWAPAQHPSTSIGSNG